MNLQQRFKIAQKKETNIFELAGAAARSLVLPHLSRRCDPEALARRQSLQNSIFPSLSEGVRGKLENLESARARLISVKVNAASERRWSALLRRVDYLLEVLTQLCGQQVTISSLIADAERIDAVTIGPESVDPADFEWKTGLIAHYEQEAEKLAQLANQSNYAARQTVLMRSVRDLERGTETIRQELFQAVVAQHLGENVWKMLLDTEKLICIVPVRMQLIGIAPVQPQEVLETVSAFSTDVEQLIDHAERFARHQNEWLEQSPASQTE